MCVLVIRAKYLRALDMVELVLSERDTEVWPRNAAADGCMSTGKVQVDRACWPTQDQGQSHLAGNMTDLRVQTATHKDAHA